MQRVSAALAVLMVVAFFGAPAGAQEEAADPMAMMAEMATPGEQHAMLAKMVGKWNYSQKMWMSPGTDPVASEGTMEAESLLDGRYVRATWSSEFMGQPFTGVGINGYDKQKGKFTNVWMDSMSTGMMMFTGDCSNDDCSSTTLTAPMTDPMSGQELTMRIVSSWSGDDSMNMEAFLVMADGSEFKNMEISANRAE